MSNKLILPSPSSRIKDAAKALSALTFNEMVEFAASVTQHLAMGTDEMSIASALAVTAYDLETKDD